MSRYTGVRVLPSGTIAYTIREPDHAGVMRQPTITRDRDTGEPFRSEYQAHQARRRHQVSLQTGRLPVSRQPLRDYLPTWLAGRDAISPSTRHTYRLSVARIVAALGDTPLGDLNAADVRAWERSALSRYAPKTISMDHHLLKLALADAVEWDLLQRHPMGRIKGPPTDSDIARPLSPEEAQRFLAAADGDTLAHLWRVALTTGARIGELLALRWVDVDFDAATIAIRRTMTTTETGARAIGDTAKTNASRRTVPLPPAAVGALRRHRDTQRFSRNPPALVFAGQRPDTPHSLSYVRKRLTAVIAAANADVEPKDEIPRIRIHDLRHTAATIMLARGVPLPAVAGILGHSDPSVTLRRYAAYIPAWGAAAVEDFERFLDASNG